jgi:AcrR family transcriptional regulator
MAGASEDPDTPEARGGAAMVVPAASGRSPRGTLDRRRILGAAVEFIDEHGIDALTMRRLGSQLGVEAMALYRYVPSREQLLDGVVETVVDELYGDPDVHMQATHGWQDYLQRLAHAASPWPTPRSSRSSRPDHQPPRGCVPRCAACAGWSPSSTA